MKLISNKTSWDQLNSVVQNYYDDNTINPDFINFKQFLFSQPNTQPIYYLKSLGDSQFSNTNVYCSFLQNHNVRIVLNSNLSGNIRNTRIFYGDTSSWNLVFVFKHNAAQIQNIQILNSNLFMGNRKIIVPIGLKQDYITYLKTQSSWDDSYEDLIYEGDEFTPIEEVNQNET